MPPPLPGGLTFGVPIQKPKTRPPFTMKAILNVLPPAQVQSILDTYTSVEAWILDVATQVSEVASSIVVEDIVL